MKFFINIIEYFRIAFKKYIFSKLCLNFAVFGMRSDVLLYILVLSENIFNETNVV